MGDGVGVSKVLGDKHPPVGGVDNSLLTCTVSWTVGAVVDAVLDLGDLPKQTVE